MKTRNSWYVNIWRAIRLNHMMEAKSGMSGEVVELEPLILAEDAETGDQFVLYTTPNGAELELRFEGEEPWATQKQMADLFGVNVPAISKHLKNIYTDGELDRGSTVSSMERVADEGDRQVRRSVDIYNIDAILSVGYRLESSKQAILFRRFANQILRQYLIKGFVIDAERLKDPRAPDYFDELLEKIRDIRASEARVWKRVLELATLCNDYDTMERKQVDNFYATLQNTLHWGIAEATAAEIINRRVDASKPNCGVAHFKGATPLVGDAKVAKNYYDDKELSELNLLTNRVLDFFEDQAKRKKAVTLEQFDEKLQVFMRFDERPVLPNRGSVTMTAAKAKASAEIKKFKARIREQKEATGERDLTEMIATTKSVAGKRKRVRSSRSKK